MLCEEARGRTAAQHVAVLRAGHRRRLVRGVRNVDPQHVGTGVVGRGSGRRVGTQRLLRHHACERYTRILFCFGESFGFEARLAEYTYEAWQRYIQASVILL